MPKRESRYKVVGSLPGSKTTYTLSGTMKPMLAALIAADFVAAWQEEMEARGPKPEKGQPRPRPRQVVLTLNL